MRKGEIVPERLKRLEAVISGKRRNFAFRLHAHLPKRKSVPAILIAVALLVVFTALKLLVDQWVGEPLPPFIFLYPTVVIAALLTGTRIGVMIAVASVLIAWFWLLPPVHSASLQSTSGLLSLQIYAASSIFLALAVGFARYTLDLAVASEELRDYDAQEAIHRIKNLLAVVQAIAIGTLRDTDDLGEYRKLVSRRLSALAGAQDVLRARREAPATVDELVQAALGPFLPDPRIHLDCARDTLVPSRYVHGLTLALFELATNSAKYGALARSMGKITLDCERSDGEIALTWSEAIQGGPIEEAPQEAGEGFGLRLIQVALRNDNGTSVRHEQSGEGVVASFQWAE